MLKERKNKPARGAVLLRQSKGGLKDEGERPRGVCSLSYLNPGRLSIQHPVGLSPPPVGCSSIACAGMTFCSKADSPQPTFLRIWHNGRGSLVFHPQQCNSTPTGALSSLDYEKSDFCASLPSSMFSFAHVDTSVCACH